ncbi:MAG: hypothetical protein AAB074_02220 [Planctomycetota bacterium]
MATATFYTALQLIDAIASAKGVTFDKHSERNKWVEREGSLPPEVWANYSALYQLSRTVRYITAGFAKNGKPTQTPTAKEVKDDSVTKRLSELERYALGCLEAMGKCPKGTLAGLSKVFP